MTTLERHLSGQENIKVIDDSISYSQYTPIDLSPANAALSQIDQKNPVDFDNFIESCLFQNNAKVAYGGYNEVRNLYKKNSLFLDEAAAERNIHIGMDLWIKAGTPVLAALDGTVYGFDCNAGAGNYGPTLVVEHHFEDQTFYTLYGHLSENSIQNIPLGTVCKKGQQIGTIGDSSVNGGYSPHLHFQIIKNIGKNFSDYPGVCHLKDLDYYLDNCPNPNLLLKIQ